MKVSQVYKEKKDKKVLSFEIFPPKKDSELKNIDETLAVLCELKPDYISVNKTRVPCRTCSSSYLPSLQ